MCHNSEINRYLKKTGSPFGENEGTIAFACTQSQQKDIKIAAYPFLDNIVLKSQM